jgi:CPA1 family monovalent cation:H+ antiporter
MAEVEALLVSVVVVFTLALLVRLLVESHEQLSYASVLVAVGLAVSVLGLSFGVTLSADLILAVLLPTIIFEGTTELDVRELRHNALLIAVLTLVGLPVAVVVLGLIGTVSFEFPLIVSLLFASVVLPTDPVAVISVFRQFEVSERLLVTLEGESLFNDGIAIAIFATLMATFQTAGSVDAATAELTTVRELTVFLADIVVVGGGGLLVGAVVGYLAHLLARRIDDVLAITLLTVVVAYGSFLLAEWVLGFSGVLATASAGLAMGIHESVHVRMSDPESFVQQVWKVAEALVSTALYVLIGATVEFGRFLAYADLVLVAAVLVVLVRALAVYPLVAVVNPFLDETVPLTYQHVMVWGGLHTVVPVGLALSLPEGLPFREEVQTMVFGVAVLSVVVQGLLMPVLLRATGLDRPSASGGTE